MGLQGKVNKPQVKKHKHYAHNKALKTQFLKVKSHVSNNIQPPKLNHQVNNLQFYINQPKDDTDKIVSFDFNHTINPLIKNNDDMNNVFLPIGKPGKDEEYCPTDTVNAVPIPAAVWLFGSALLGLLGVKRKSV